MNYFWNSVIDDALATVERFTVKDTQRGKAPPNKTPAYTKSTNMGIWFVDTLNQIFIKGLYDRSILYFPFCLS